MDRVRMRQYRVETAFNPNQSSHPTSLTSLPSALGFSSATSSKKRRALAKDEMLEEMMIKVNLARARMKPPPPDPTSLVHREEVVAAIELERKSMNYFKQRHADPTRFPYEEAQQFLLENLMSTKDQQITKNLTWRRSALTGTSNGSAGQQQPAVTSAGRSKSRLSVLSRDSPFNTPRKQ